MGRLGLFIISVLFVSMAYSQDTGNISGRISDGEIPDEPLLFAEVYLSDTEISAQTNFHGNFELTNVLPGDYILNVAYLGYETLQIPITVSENDHVYISRSLSANRLQHPENIVSETVSSLSSDK